MPPATPPTSAPPPIIAGQTILAVIAVVASPTLITETTASFRRFSESFMSYEI